MSAISDLDENSVIELVKENSKFRVGEIETAVVCLLAVKKTEC